MLISSAGFTHIVNFSSTVGKVQIISISSLKGGVGKTSIALGLVSAAVHQGYSTLLIDLDPQADATTSVDIRQPAKFTTADVLKARSFKNVSSAISESTWSATTPNDLHVIAGSPDTVQADAPHSRVSKLKKIAKLRPQLEKYDVVIIDCPPSHSTLTKSAWIASDKVLVVSEPSLYSIAAAEKARHLIDYINDIAGSNAALAGIILNKVSPQSPEHMYRVREAEQTFGALLIDLGFPNIPAIEEAQGSAKAIHQWDTEEARSAARTFDELLKRLILL